MIPNIADFEVLLEYYHRCYSYVNYIHFNSENTRKVYESYLGTGIGQTVSITHKGIVDNRQTKSFSTKGLKIGFIGNETPYKGLPILIDVVSGLDIDVYVWGGKKKENGRIHYRGKFKTEQIANVFKEMDLLVVPSIWKETFSLVTLEALSYGVPVLASDNVGAQDIIKGYASNFVYHTTDELREILESLIEDKAPLIQYNQVILSRSWKHDVLCHAQEIIENIYLK